MNVKGELRLELRGVDVLAVEAVRHPLRKLHACNRRRREALCIVNHKVTAVGRLVIHKCCQIAIILPCAHAKAQAERLV